MSLKRLCIHWTAGSYQSLERDHYHYTVGPDGMAYPGHKPPEANVPKNGQYLTNEAYVAHCGGGNSHCIGVAMIGMAGCRWVPGKGYDAGPYPLTATQCERTWKLNAELCRKYSIPVTPDTVFTHYEFGKRNPNTSSRGKIDIVYLPHVPELKPAEVGDYIRGKVSWYLLKL